MKNRGFTLIELLVVISIISLLAGVVLSSVNSARAKARDVDRKSEFKQLSNAFELCYDGACNGVYPDTVGYLSNLVQLGGPTNTNFSILIPTYISKIDPDPSGNNGRMMYYRISNTKYAFYARLESPSAADIATVTNGDAFDQSIGTTYSMNYRFGN